MIAMWESCHISCHFIMFAKQLIQFANLIVLSHRPIYYHNVFDMQLRNTTVLHWSYPVTFCLQNETVSYSLSVNETHKYWVVNYV